MAEVTRTFHGLLTKYPGAVEAIRVVAADPYPTIEPEGTPEDLRGLVAHLNSGYVISIDLSFPIGVDHEQLEVTVRTPEPRLLIEYWRRWVDRLAFLA